MQKHLPEYIKTYKEIYSKQFCQETVNQLKTVNFETHRFYNPRDNTYMEVGNDFKTYIGGIPNTKHIMETTWKIIEQYIVKDINFHWFDRWHGYSGTKFNHYTPGTNMKQHCDHIRDIFDGERKGTPIVTVLLSLNDDYEGGDLIFFDDDKYHLSAGDVIVFPSNFLFPHRIETITSGERFSCVNWVW